MPNGTKVAATALNAIILGAPGCGKGTISKKLINGFNFHHLSTGDLLRDAIAQKTPLGLEAQSIMASGKFVSDETVVKLAADSYKNILDVSSKTPRILFDGFPRTMRQAQALDSKDIAIKIHLALYIDVPDVTIINRISSRWVHAESGRTYASDYNPPKKPGFDDVTGEPLIRRPDDEPDTIKYRLEKYNEMTAPLLDYYRSKGVLFGFAGTESDVIYKDIAQFLKLKIPRIEL